MIERIQGTAGEGVVTHNRLNRFLMKKNANNDDDGFKYIASFFRSPGNVGIIYCKHRYV